MLTKVELDRIVETIRQAENNTSAEIRVCVAKNCKIDPLEAAYAKFRKLKMDKTTLRNSVLIYVAPNDNKAAIIGDTGIDKIAVDDFWDSTLHGMIQFFRNNNAICDGICYGVEKVGNLVKKFFPISEDDFNELSDEVIIDEN